MCSGDTLRLVSGLFLTRDLGARELKGIEQPMRLHQVVQQSGVRSRLDVAPRRPHAVRRPAAGARAARGPVGAERRGTRPGGPYLRRGGDREVPAAELRSEVARLSGDVRTVLVLGHNPGWEEAVTELSGREMRITTANVVLLEGEGATWREALRGPWSVAGVVRPKQL